MDYSETIKETYGDLLEQIAFYKNFYYGIRIKTDQQKIARKLKLFTKLKFKQQYGNLH